MKMRSRLSVVVWGLSVITALEASAQTQVTQATQPSATASTPQQSLSRSAKEARTLAKFEIDFVLAQWQELNCDYEPFLEKRVVGMIPAVLPGLSQHFSEKLQRVFQPLSGDVCVSAKSNMTRAMSSPNWSMPSAHAFPLYTEVIEEQSHAQQRAQAISQGPFKVAIQAPLSGDWANAESDAKQYLLDLRKYLPRFIAMPNFSFVTMSAENDLRAKLGVDTGHSNDSRSCDAISASAPDAAVNVYNLNFWQGQLIETGYDCTIRLFKATSLGINRLSSDARMYNAQEIFNRERREIAQQPHSRILNQPLKGLNILVFPQLAYDAPAVGRKMEKLDYETLAQKLAPLGAEVHILERVTPADKEDQI
jgi:hypothetical protein